MRAVYKKISFIHTDPFLHQLNIDMFKEFHSNENVIIFATDQESGDDTTVKFSYIKLNDFFISLSYSNKQNIA